MKNDKKQEKARELSPSPGRMLPLDEWDGEVRDAFFSFGVKEEDVLLTLDLDLDVEGAFGRTVFAFLPDEKKIVRISCSADKESASEKRIALDGETQPFTHGEWSALTYPSDGVDSMYVDNFAASCRLLFRLGEEGKETVVAAYSSNARKKKLFAFIDIMERLKNGEDVPFDDPIFEQFNLKCPKCGRRYSDQNRKICMHCLNKSAIFVRMMAYFKPHAPRLALLLLFLLLSSGVALLSPVVSGLFLYDKVISETGELHELKWLILGVLALLGMGLVSQLISIANGRNNWKMAQRIILRMKLDVFKALQRLSLSYFNNTQTGRLITRVNFDAEKVRSLLISGIPPLIVNSLNFIGLFVILMVLNWKLTLMIFIPVPLIVVIMKVMFPKLWRANTRTWRASSAMNAMLGDSLSGVRVVKAFAKEVDETHRFRAYNEKRYETNLYANTINLTIFPLIGLLIGVSSHAIWGASGFEVMGGNMSYGQFTTYIGYIGMIFGPLGFFTTFTSLVTDATNSAARMFEVMDTPPEITDVKNPVRVDKIKGDIEFRKVCFHYQPNRPILKNMSFTIRAGDHVGLVGQTGAGKSTVANLICRLYDCVSGAVYIDGHNIREIALEDIRRNIAIVSQEIFIFQGTVAENVRYARPDATYDEVVAACRAANAHDFILALPKGYETLVGPGKHSLSGGEKQRISIARALLRQPSVLILDEATAAMDTETEKQIQSALEKLVEGRTTITIAHRLATLRDCNVLYAVENGQIAEGGTHEELIAKKGVYYKLYKLQTDAMKRILTAS